MADLKFVDQHNMVACLEKTEENAEFHQIFWNIATSKTVKSVKQIHAIVDGKVVVISESSVRSDILFNDEDGIACLTNDEIFENLALMGYEQLSTKLTFQKEPQTETPLTVSHEHQTEAHIKQIIPSPSIYQRKQRKTQKHRRTKKVIELPQTRVPLDHGADEAIHKEGVTVWKRAITTNDGLVATQDNDNIIRTQTTSMPNTRSERVLEKPNESPLLEGHTSGSGEGSMEHTFELMDTVPPTPHKSPLTGGYTYGSDVGRLKLKELMAIYTKLSKQVLYLEKEKDVHAVEILKLKQRVNKLERKRNSSISHPRRRIYRQVESSNDDLDEEDASKHGRERDKTKSMFQDSDFDVLDNDMEDIEGETVHTTTTGVSVAQIVGNYI
ncbi:hypothetical protein Tco_0360051 [Tanacetum coccineum]